MVFPMLAIVSPVLGWSLAAVAVAVLLLVFVSMRGKAGTQAPAPATPRLKEHWLLASNQCSLSRGVAGAGACVPAFPRIETKTSKRTATATAARDQPRTGETIASIGNTMN